MSEKLGEQAFAYERVELGHIVQTRVGFGLVHDDRIAGKAVASIDDAKHTIPYPLAVFSGMEVFQVLALGNDLVFQAMQVKNDRQDIMGGRPVKTR